MAKCQFHERLWAKAVFAAKKKIHNPQHISWFFTASDDFL